MNIKVHEAIDPDLNFVLEKDLKKSIQELKEDLEKINHGIMSASQWMIIKRTREIIDKVFGRRLTGENGNG